VQLLRQHHDAERVVLSVRELREHERVLMKGDAQFAVCISNKGYAASLEVRKIYRLIPDKAGAKHGLVRVVDEMGEDYLFPEEYFVSLRLPQAVERAVLRASP
jgi:hypothetical protein